MTQQRPPAQRQRRSRTHNLVYAVLFFVLGVIGLLIPVVPQVPFFIMSALFLSLAVPRVRRALRRWRHRHPKIDETYRKWRAKARKKRQQAIRTLREAAHHGRQ